MADNQSVNKYPLEWQAGIDLDTRFDRDAQKIIDTLNRVNAEVARTQQQAVNNINAAASNSANGVNQLNNAVRTNTQASQQLADTQLRTARAQEQIVQNRLDTTLDRQAVAAGRAAERSANLRREYSQLAMQLRDLDRYAQDVGVRFGTASPQFQEASARANAQRTELNDINHALGNYRDQVGGYFQAISRGFGTAFGFIRQLANVIPNFGIGTFFLVVGTGLSKLYDAFTANNKAIDITKENIKNLNEVYKQSAKDASESVDNLKILYKAATDVTIPMKERIEAAKELKKEFPDEFANANAIAIVNGKLKDSYDALTDSIKEQSRVKALRGKYDELESKRLEIEIEGQKIKNKLINDQNKITTIGFVSNNSGATDANGVNRAGVTTLSVQKQRDLLYEARKNDILENINKQDAIKKQQDLLEKVAGGNKNFAKALTDGNNLIQEPLKRFNEIIKNASSKADLENLKSSLQAKLNALTPGDPQIKAYGDALKKVEALEKQYSPKVADDTKAQNLAESALKRKEDLLRQILALQNESDKKGLNQSDSEIKAIDDKFAALILKIKQFNADPKNTLKISSDDIDKLDTSRIKEIESVRAKESLDYYKNNLDQQKKVFDDFESYKLKVGSVKAEERFAKELNGNKSFVDYLTNQLETTIDPNDKSRATADRKALLEKQLQDQLILQSANYTKLLESFKSYQSEIENLTATHNDKVKQLAANPEALQDEQLSYNQQLDALQSSLSDRIGKIEGFNNHVIELTRKQAKAQIAALKDIQAGDPNLSAAQNSDIDANIAKLQTALAASGGLTRNYREDLLRNKQILLDQLKPLQTTSQKWSEIQGKIAVINAQLAGTKSDSFQKDVKKVSEYADAASQAFGTLAGSLADINPNLSDTLATLGEITKTIGDAGKLAGSLASGDVVGIISGIANVASDLIGLFTRGRKSAQESQAAIQKYNDDLKKGTIDYNILLRAQKDLQEDITKLTSQQLKDRVALLNTSKDQSKADYNTLLAQIQSSGQQVTGERTEKYGGFLGAFQKTKVVQDLAGLGGADYNKLLELYTKGQLTDATKTWFEELQKVHDEMDGIDEATKAAKDQLDQVSTGTTSDSIASAIIDGFKKGYKTAADFAGTFKDLMQQALLSTFEVDYLKPKIAEFYKNFASLSEDQDGLTQADIDALRAQYATIITNSAAQVDKITSVTGGLGGTTANPNTVGGAISTANQASIDLLSGRLGGLQLAQLQSNEIEGKILAVVTNNGGANRQMVDISQKMLDQLIAIESNTGITASFAPFLKTIAQNTYDNTSVALRAAGLTGIPTR